MKWIFIATLALAASAQTLPEGPAKTVVVKMCTGCQVIAYLTANFGPRKLNVITEEVLFATGAGVAPWMASVTFGGPDLRTAYIGSLKGKRIPYFRAPVAGLPMVHWNDR
jgi:hypothetical protein